MGKKEEKKKKEVERQRQKKMFDKVTRKKFIFLIKRKVLTLTFHTYSKIQFINNQLKRNRKHKAHSFLYYTLIKTKQKYYLSHKGKKIS